MVTLATRSNRCEDVTIFSAFASNLCEFCIIDGVGCERSLRMGVSTGRREEQYNMRRLPKRERVGPRAVIEANSWTTDSNKARLISYWYGEGLL
ncbi:hypothetical protein RRG08_064444 [Elysia crispata]|uniref:Uncharacterized protein n=1 Tax=Elysia crispata TaxID=231223 RepID=A0AAE0YZ04_9GAST|nr:hypothetical protein RRG08_064444 [Elysia crispata]